MVTKEFINKGNSIGMFHWILKDCEIFGNFHLSNTILFRNLSCTSTTVFITVWARTKYKLV